MRRRKTFAPEVKGKIEKLVGRKLDSRELRCVADEVIDLVLTGDPQTLGGAVFFQEVGAVIRALYIAVERTVGVVEKFRLSETGKRHIQSKAAVVSPARPRIRRIPVDVLLKSIAGPATPQFGRITLDDDDRLALIARRRDNRHHRREYRRENFEWTKVPEDRRRRGEAKLARTLFWVN